MKLAEWLPLQAKITVQTVIQILLFYFFTDKKNTHNKKSMKYISLYFHFFLPLAFFRKSQNLIQLSGIHLCYKKVILTFLQQRWMPLS